MAQRPDRIDVRWFQLASLTALLGYGCAVLDFGVSPSQIALIGAVALAVEAIAAPLRGARFDPRSPLISALSLALLLRAEHDALLVAGAALAIGSKALVRVRGKHVFNPTCFAIVALLAFSDGVWVSAGQWGSVAVSGFALACAGTWLVHRSERSDVPIAFLVSYAGLLLLRALWLGDPLTIPLHALQSGALLLFAFFMISDPRTTPDSRAGRLIFCSLTAAAAFWIQFGWYRPNALLWALAFCAPTVPLLDRVFPGGRFAWTRAYPILPLTKEFITPVQFRTPFRRKSWRWLALPALAVAVLLVASRSQAFCGFYVGKADTELFNKASQVVLVRDGDRTVITMSNDYEGELDEFATVIPVPTFIEREQIHIGDRTVIDHLDAYTAPRLVEYFDPDPCTVARYEMADRALASKAPAAPDEEAGRGRSRGVTIEASYTVGEYDILILSAEESQGLATWLRENGYRLPRGAERILRSYLKQGMRFFVAKVSLGEQQRLGTAYLRPLQVAYESPKFMLPIRLGTLNANGAQALFVYALTRAGRVETTNYRTVKLPTGMDLPVTLKEEFGDFYRALFDQQVKRERMKAVFLEYAWDMNWCDPCAADPLSHEELRDLGVFWLDPDSRGGPARDVFVTRLHVRYDAAHFPADLAFQETGNRENFQGRYVMRHPFEGATCAAATPYYQAVRERQRREAEQLAALTGWKLSHILDRLDLDRWVRPGADGPWWQRIWSQ